MQDGRPVYIQRLGKLDVNALSAITTQDRQLRRFVLEYEKFLTERLPACSKAVGHPVETSCTIMDLAGVRLTSFFTVKEYVSQAAAIGQDRYPECMGKSYIINAPWAFSTVWSIVKPWLDEVKVAKIDIVSSAYVKEKLLSQIPAEFGGTCQCVGRCLLSDVGLGSPQTVPNEGRHRCGDRRSDCVGDGRRPGGNLPIRIPNRLTGLGATATWCA